MIYTVKNEATPAKPIVADDMILTVGLPTSAGSKMLDGYVSLFEAEALTRLSDAGYELIGKTDVGEFSIDLLGESSHNGPCLKDEKLLNPSAEAVKAKDAVAAICLDVNGSVRRAAAQNGLVSVKPTYGTVSRYGVIPAACSGDTVSVMAATAGVCRDVLSVMAGHDDKDGTSLPEELCARLSATPTAPRKVAILKSMTDGINDDVRARLDEFCQVLKSSGIEVCEIDDSVIAASRPAWNVLMSAELCNNVSRYDGVKYGYRAQSFTNLDELYTNSRTEAFGELLKTAIIFGSETLSTENYMKVYDKSLRTRRVIVEAFEKLFAEYDAVITPACSSTYYTEEQIKANKYLSYEENYYTAPASITGLPAVVVGGVQLIGKAFSESTLLGLAEIYEKEGK